MKKKSERQRLLRRIEILQREVQELKQGKDRNFEECKAHREYWMGKMRWFLELLSNQQTPDMKWLVEDMAKHWTRTGKWGWYPW